MVNAVSADITAGETTGVGSVNGEAGTHPLNRKASTAMILRLRFFRCIVFPPFPHPEFLVSLRLLALPKQLFRQTALFRIVEILILVQGVAVHRQH